MTGGHVRAGSVDVWVERQGAGPDVLLIPGLGDPAEIWEFQLQGLANRYRLTAFDSPGAGRTPMPAGSMSVAGMADDTAALLRELEITCAHVAGFSGGSAVAQELALRHPALVRSLVLVGTWDRQDAYLRTLSSNLRWLAEAAPTERAFLEAFALWLYTPRSYEDGAVDKFINEALAFPHKPSAEAMQRGLEAFAAHDTTGRLASIRVPTLVLAGGQDIITPPHFGRLVADAIPRARLEILVGEAHLPFQEAPDLFNEEVDGFWQEVEDREQSFSARASESNSDRAGAVASRRARL